MVQVTRREFTTVALGALAGAGLLGPFSARAGADSRVRGVLIGAQTYSFRDRGLEAAIDGLKAGGISGVELWQGHYEPREPGKRPDREKLRAWRLSTPASYFKDVRAKFDAAGIGIYAVNISFRDDWTDDEVVKGFEQAEAIGVKTVTASSNQTTVARVAPLAARRGMVIAVHNHSRIEPNEFATPDDFLKAMAVSPAVRVNLDIGHFTAANFDAVDFLRTHHDRIVTLHIKDRKRNQGENVPFGQGDTPIKPVLKLLRDEKWAIPAGIEYEYRGADAVAEMKRCVEYCREALLET